MSIRQGNKVIAGHINYHPDLFDHKWADHILNDVSWLRADTFSWQDGGVYQAAYNHLADDISGKSLSSETISGVTVQFYLADDGHKICPDSQESNVASIFTATGVAWYYIIDTENQRFKLPRTKYGFTGLRDTVGNYVEPGLPNITGNIRYSITLTDANGVFTSTSGSGANKWGSGEWGACNFADFNASRSSSIYGNSTTVQAPATQMYLYFYIGNFTQTAIENTAGLNAELFNDKVDVGHEVIAFQAPTAENNYTWYRKYADGWVEQGGISDSGTSAQTISLPVTMANTNYTIEVTSVSSSSNNNVIIVGFESVTTTSFVTRTNVVNNASATATATSARRWLVCGMAA